MTMALQRQLSLVVGIIMLAVGLPASICRGEAGMSEIARARAFWLRKPYALKRTGDMSMGPDTVRLIRGRDETAIESWNWPFPMGICGIVELDTLVAPITSYACGDQFLVVMTISEELGRDYGDYGCKNEDSVAVIDLADPTARLSWFHTTQEALKSCTGDPALSGQITWQTFDDDLSRAQSVRMMKRYGPLLIAVALVAIMLVWFQVGAAGMVRSRCRAKFLCLYSAVTAVWAIVSALLLPELCSWLFALFSAGIGVATLGEIKKAQVSLPPAYRNTAIIAACLGCFAAILLPPLLGFAAGHLR